MTTEKARAEGRIPQGKVRHRAEKNPPRVPEKPQGDILAELAKIRRELAGMGASLASMDVSLRQVDAIQVDVARRLRCVEDGVNRVTDVVPLVHRHEADIVARLHDQRAEWQDIESEQRRDQQKLWKRFDVITRGPVIHVVNDILRRNGLLNDEVAKAQLIGRVVRLLFPSGPDGDPDAIDSGTIDQEHFDSLLRNADRIRQDANVLGMVAYWGPVDEHPDWFEEWPSSLPAGSAFVVIPAWVADGRRVGLGILIRA